MPEFKNSKLFFKLYHGKMLTDDAWSFMDACMDDFFVDEDDCIGGTMYELRGMMRGYYKGKEVSVTQIYYADLCGMAALIEHLALTQKLMMEHNGFGTDYIEEENRK